MAVLVTSSTILKPSSSSPHSLVGARVPLTIFDMATCDLHVPLLFAFRAPAPTNEELKKGLAEVLSHFPHLAGRMMVDERGHPCFLLDDAGIRLVETRVAAALPDELASLAYHELSQLHPPVDEVEELLQVQLNKYSCGGLVIGVTAHHRVADGRAWCAFFVAWAAAVRRSLGPNIPSPFLDRAAIPAPRIPPRCEFDHWAVEYEKRASPLRSVPAVENLVAHFTSEFIAKLKAHTHRDHSAGSDGLVLQRRWSTFECLLAHVWKKATAARQVADDEFTEVMVSVDGRARMKPAVPGEYFGNLVLCAFPRLRAGELLRESHEYAAKAIREAVERVDDAYFRSFIDFGAMIDGEGREALVLQAPQTGNSVCPNLEVDSWLRFNVHDIDFGTGAPCSFIPPSPCEGVFTFVPSRSGGVDVFMVLTPGHAQTFRQICHSID